MQFCIFPLVSQIDVEGYHCKYFIKFIGLVEITFAVLG